MEITIYVNGQAVSVEVSVEVYAYLNETAHKDENLLHEQRRHWDGRELEQIAVTHPGREESPEQVYSIVDSRYLSRLPFIITTNLALSELQNPPDLARARIYNRILERCVPICFSGKNYRAENAAKNREDAQTILQSDLWEGND